MSATNTRPSSQAAADEFVRSMQRIGGTTTLSTGDRSVTIEGVSRVAINVPSDSDFEADQVDYLAAPELDELAAQLRDEKPQLAGIDGVRIAFWWKRKGGSNNGKCRLGQCQKTPPRERALNHTTFTISLSADHCREFRLTDLHLEALLFHELLHAQLKEVEVKDPETKEVTTEYRPAIAGHDLEMFEAEVEEYGVWTAELKRAQALFTQARLPGLGAIRSGGAA